jgi:hypothetical protein
MKKKTLLIIASIIAVLSTSIIVYASEAYKLVNISSSSEKDYYPEPKSDANLEPGIKWNPYVREYYDSKAYEWDTVEKKYVDLKLKKNKKQTGEVIQSKDPVEELMNSTDTNPINIAFKHYWEHYDKRLLAKSHYNPSEDQSFIDNILTIDPKYLPEMIDNVKKSSFSIIMMHAIGNISRVKDLTQVSEMPDGQENWLLKLEEVTSNMPDKVKKISDNIKNSTNESQKVQLKDDLSNFGLFAVPFMIDEINSGNTELSEVLNNILNTDLISFRKGKETEQNPTSKVDWKSWAKDNQETLAILKKLRVCQLLCVNSF